MITRGFLVERIAAYITKLPDGHPASQMFGAKLVHTPSLPTPVSMPDGFPTVPVPEPSELDPNNNIFLFSFPVDETDKPVGDNLYAELVEGTDVVGSNSPGLCIRPESGMAPDHISAKNYPAFSLICRHRYKGAAYGCLYYLIQELSGNTVALLQNGVIMAVQSEPALQWGDRRDLFAYKASFRCMVADKLH